MNYDLHIHSNFSDGKASIREILSKAKELNIGISIADHNELRGSIIASKIAKKLNIPFIIGVELGTKEGKEMLLYFKDECYAKKFYENEIKPFKTSRMTRINRYMSEFLSADLKIKYNIFLAIIPHPFGVLYKNIYNDMPLGEKMIEFCDGIECINASQSSKSNTLSKILCAQKQKLAFASSDAHLIKNIGKLSTNITFDKYNILKTDISHNNYKDDFLTLIQSLYQISKINLNYFLKDKIN